VPLDPQRDERTDARIIEESLTDPRVFAAVYDRHAAILFRFLVRRVGRENADELLGDTFRIAFERRDTFDVMRPDARPWLYGIATNLVAKYRRSEARRLRATARLAEDRGPESLADRVGASVDARRSLPMLVDAIADLPDGERDALLLYAWEDLSYDEIALALGIPIGTVRSRLNRARSRLRELSPARLEARIET
jgi:RNA polymerase sigma-70 factor (ECF subfamily)